MSISQLILNAALLAFVLLTNLGTRRVTTQRLLLPLVLVAVAGWAFLRDVPTAGGDGRLELVGALTGVALGAAAGALMRVGHDADGVLVTHASAGYAVLWLAVIGGRVAFAQSATGWAARSRSRCFWLANRALRYRFIGPSSGWTSATSSASP